MIETRSAPRSVAWSFCRRHQLPEGGAPETPSKSFLRALRAYDRQLELYWHPLLHRWILYRCARHGGVPGDDHLVKEFELSGPGGQYRSPGHWVIERLQELDRTRGGSVDPAMSSRLYQQQIQADLAAMDEAKQREMDEIGADWAHEITTYGYGRQSIHVNRS